MIKQGSQEWKDEKLGVISGTRALQLMSSNITRKRLKAQLVRELVTSDKKDFFKQSLQDRLDMEPEASSYYSLMNDAVVVGQDSYIESDIHPMLACSPDGLVDVYEGKPAAGGVDFKRLDEENHILMLDGGTPEKTYVMQCHWCMFITGREWWELFYYCETLPDEMRTCTIRFERDENIMAEMKVRANDMINEVQAFLNEYGLGGLLG